MAKDELIYARISSELKRKLAMASADRGEAEAVIVREALNNYFARAAVAQATLLDSTAASPTPSARPVNYRKRRGKG